MKDTLAPEHKESPQVLFLDCSYHSAALLELIQNKSHA